MRRLSLITAVVALVVGTGVAVAHNLDSKSIAAVAATFSASATSNVSVTSCTGADGTYYQGGGTYTGTAASADSTLNGPVTIQANALVNAATMTGVVTGTLRIAGSAGNVDANFEGVFANGTLAGFAQAWDNGRRIEANISAGFIGTSGFTNGMIGGGTAGGAAIAITPGDCQRIPPPRPDKIGVHAYVSAVSSTSITAGGVTCAVPANLQGAVANVHVGDRIEMHCYAGNPNTLYQLSRDHYDRHR